MIGDVTPIHFWTGQHRHPGGGGGGGGDPMTIARRFSKLSRTSLYVPVDPPS